MVLDFKLLKFQKARSTPFSQKTFALVNETEASDRKLTLSVYDSDAAALNKSSHFATSGSNRRP